MNKNKERRARQKIALLLSVVLLVFVSSNMILASANTIWNSGQKINFVPAKGDQMYNVSTWLYDSCPELGLNAYEDLMVPANRWNIFSGILRTYQAKLALSGAQVLTDNGHNLEMFADKSSLVPAAQNEAKVMVRLGILNGRPKEDGNLYMDMKDNITRAEVAKVLSVFYQSLNLNGFNNQSYNNFVDVNGHWAEEYIQYCYERGLMRGKGNGIFDPEGFITKEEAIQIIINLIGVDEILPQNVAKAINETYYVTTNFDEENNKNKTSSSTNYGLAITPDKWYYTVTPGGTITVRVKYNSSRTLTVSVEGSNCKITDKNHSNGTYTLTVRGVSEGNSFIKCRYSNVADDERTLYLPIFVRGNSYSKASSITSNTSYISMNVGEITSLANTLTITPQNAKYNGIYYMSADPSIVSINHLTGTMYALSGGTTYIYAVTYGATRKISVNVSGYYNNYQPGYGNGYGYDSYGGFSLNSSYATINQGEKLDLKRYIYNTTGRNITYRTDNSLVATVTSNGIVTGKNGGNAMITITCGGQPLYFNVVVIEDNYYEEEIIDISIYKSFIDLEVGDTFDLDAWVEVYPSYADKDDLRYSSDDTDIAKVGKSTGEITAISEGTTRIRVYSGYIERYFTVTVNENYDTITAINISKSSVNLNKGNSYYLSNDITVKPSKFENTLEYSSSNNLVATVDNIGKIEAVGAGNAIITVSGGNITKTVNIVVNDTGGSNSGNSSELKFATNDIINLGVGMQFNLYSVLIGDHSNVTFSTDTNGIVTISNGIVRAIGKGTTTIIARDNKGNTASLSFNIY